jgi:hypothetical protein
MYTFEQLKEDVRREAEALRERNKRPKTYSYLIGEVFGKLTVMSIYREGKVAYAKCKCSCGNDHSVKVRCLTEGSSTSCGCFRLERVRKAITKYNYNRTFFSSNTPEMYYVLGLMYTDGNLSPDKCRFRLGFQAEDKYLLEMVGMALKGSKKLDLNKANGAYEVAGTDEVIYQQLKDHGIMPRKSLVMTIKDHLVNNSHFWRGVIDGNGWVSLNQNRLVLGLCGTISVIKSFANFCTIHCNVQISSLIERRVNWGQISTSGHKALSILNVLYQGKGDWYMKRKFNKYIAFLRGETETLEL